MARGAGKKEQNTFVKGIITEASPLTFPENASLDESNFILNIDGSRERRLGIDYEGEHVLVNSLYNLENTDAAVQCFAWENIEGRADTALAVVQVGSRVFFFDLLADSLSSSPKNGGLSVWVGGDAASPMSFASILGKLVVANGTRALTVLEYDRGSDAITKSQYNIRTRDLWGVESGLATETRPSTLSEAHHYNLRNRGWREPNIKKFFNTNGVYPSDADIQAFGKKTGASGIESFDGAQAFAQFTGSTEAPRGKHTMDVFNRGLNRKTRFSSFTTLPDDYHVGGVSHVASYGGRIFYGITVESSVDTDDKSPNVGSMIFFSQVATNISSLGKCYSEADPSSEHISDVIDTDGGFVTIPALANVLDFAIRGTRLVVVAKTGVWEISGGEQAFSATNFQLDEISSQGATSPRAVLSSDGLVSYWSDAGIYILQENDVSGRSTPTNISENSIQGLFRDIPSPARNRVRTTFDSALRQVRWMYDKDNSLDSAAYCNQELVFDSTLGAFYISDIQQLSGDSPYIADYLEVPAFSQDAETEDVTDGGLVVTDVGVDVTSTVFRSLDKLTTTKYLVVVKTGATHSFTFATYADANFKDWVGHDGTGADAPAFLLTGYDTQGDSAAEKQVTYIDLFCRLTEDGYVYNGSGDLDFDNASSCLAQAQWEWTDSANGGRWSREFQAYRLRRNYVPESLGDSFDKGFTVMRSRNKLRGKGRSLSLLFKTEPGKNLHIYGWSTNLTAEVE
jgi:hypothetical protein